MSVALTAEEGPDSAGNQPPRLAADAGARTPEAKQTAAVALPVGRPLSLKPVQTVRFEVRKRNNRSRTEPQTKSTY
jgi:hypothetical protein